jgi:periplasmic protein TonB
MLNHMNLDQEPSFSALSLTELELSDEVSLLRWMNKLSVTDMVLGAGGSALVHILIAATAILLPLMQPRTTTLPGAFVTVNLVELGGSMGGSCDTASLEGVSGGVQTEPPHPVEKQSVKVPLPEPPKTARAVERVSTKTEKTAKKAPPPPTPKPAPDQVAPVAPLEDPAGLASLSSRDAAAETAGTEGGKGHGAKGVGEGAGFSSAGGLAAGFGSHGGEFNADAVDQIPQALHKVEPLYPQRARKQGVCGKVVLRFLVESDGRVTRPSIVEASPSGHFEQSAMDAIRHWRFKPGIYRGKAVATWVVLPVHFNLTN